MQLSVTIIITKMIFENLKVIVLELSETFLSLQLLCNRPTHSSSTSLSSSSSPSLSSSSPPSSSSISSTVKRRRRGIENVEVKTKFAASKIRVYDNKDVYQMENKSPQKSGKLSYISISSILKPSINVVNQLISQFIENVIIHGD